MKIKVSPGQSLEDIAIEQYGTVEGVILILMDNNLSPDSLLIGGQELVIRDEVPDINGRNQTVQRLIAEKVVHPNSGFEDIRELVLYIEEEYIDDDYFE